ncbi:hypothetical protein JCM6882_000851 [Rhodosporidiobolus microsporus]
MHPSSAGITARSASPAHRAAAQHHMAASPDLARHRHPAHPQPYPYPGDYGVAPDAKDPYLAAQPPYGSAYANGAYRPRSPAGGGGGGGGGGGMGEQGTLSGLLTTLYRQAQSTFSSGASNANAPFSNLNGGGNGGASSLLPKLSSTRLSAASASGADDSAAHTASLIPSASTIGFVLLCSLWYLSSAFSSNTGKSILTRFRYPVTLTFVQFAFVAGYSLLILFLRDRFGAALGGGHGHGHALGGGGGGLAKRRGSMGTLGGWGVRKPSRSMFHGTFVMSLFQIAGHVFSSMAIARVPVSTVHTIKALSPLFTVLSYAALFGVRYTPATYTALLPLTLGVMLACSFNIRANAVGFLCALGSTFIFVAQNIFSKKLLPKENKDVGAEERTGGGGGATAAGAGSGGGAAKLDKLNLLFYSSGMAFFLMIPIWLYSDASTLFFSPPLLTPSSIAANPENSTSTLLFYFFLNGTVHFAQNLLAFSLLARTSPVTYSIASLVKRIAVICIAIVWSHQQVSRIQAVGMSMTFGGLWMYNRAKGDVDRGEKRRAQAEKRAEMSLPTTLGDARALDGTETPPPPHQHLPPTSINIGGGSGGAGGDRGGPLSPTSGGFASNGHSGPPPPPPPHHSAYSVHPDDPYGNGAGGGARNRQLSQGNMAFASGGGGGGGGVGVYR